MEIVNSLVESSINRLFDLTLKTNLRYRFRVALREIYGAQRLKAADPCRIPYFQSWSKEVRDVRNHSSFFGGPSVSCAIFNHAKLVPAVRKINTSPLLRPRLIPKKTPFSLFATIRLWLCARNETEESFFSGSFDAKSCPTRHPHAVKQDYPSPMAILQSPGKRSQSDCTRTSNPIIHLSFRPDESPDTRSSTLPFRPRCVHGFRTGRYRILKLYFMVMPIVRRIHLLRESISLRASIKINCF